MAAACSLAAKWFVMGKRDHSRSTPQHVRAGTVLWLRTPLHMSYVAMYASNLCLASTTGRPPALGLSQYPHVARTRTRHFPCSRGWVASFALGPASHEPPRCTAVICVSMRACLYVCYMCLRVFVHVHVCFKKTTHFPPIYKARGCTARYW